MKDTVTRKELQEKRAGFQLAVERLAENIQQLESEIERATAMKNANAGAVIAIDGLLETLGPEKKLALEPQK
jgi:hypothetical protein